MERRVDEHDIRTSFGERVVLEGVAHTQIDIDPPQLEPDRGNRCDVFVELLAEERRPARAPATALPHGSRHPEEELALAERRIEHRGPRSPVGESDHQLRHTWGV